jgi:hypothetical protein
MSLTPEMPTIPQGSSTTLFASYKKFAKKQRKAQNTLLHYENNAAANIITNNLRINLPSHPWSPEFDVEICNDFNAQEQTNWHNTLLSMQMHRAEFLRKYIAEKQQYLDKYLEDSFIYSELNKLTFQKLTVEELQPAVEDFKTLLNAHLLPRPKKPTNNLPPTPQIFTDVDMTQDDPAAFQATSSSSSSSSSSAPSSAKPLKTPQSNPQPTTTPSLEMKIETLTALVLKATKSIAILEQKFPDGPPTVGKREPTSQNSLRTKNPRHQPRIQQASVAPTPAITAFPAQNAYYSALPISTYQHMPPFAPGYNHLQQPLQLQHQQMQLQHQHHQQSPAYFNTAFNTNNSTPTYYSQPPPPLGQPPYDHNASATQDTGNRTTSRNPGSRNPRLGNNGRKKDKHV